jgi:mono/diheme cytochrome c family protein
MVEVRSIKLGLILMLLFSCSSENRDASKRQLPVGPKSSDAPREHPGKIVYMQFCLACHMEHGEGVPGLYPPLTQTPAVLGDKSELISIVLNGMEGPIVVNGENYNNIMAKLDYLQDQQVADVLSYVRTNFGNTASKVTASDVQAVRRGGASVQ